MKASKKAPARTHSHASKKARSRAPQKKAPARTQRYNPEMIRDFLMQLQIELQADHVAHANSGVANDEGAGEVEPYLKKHGSRLLYRIEFDDVTDEQRTDIDRTMATARQKQLEALQFLLETAFKEALACAGEQAKAGKERSIKFSADDWLKWTANGTS
jgi:hypothetical protein